MAGNRGSLARHAKIKAAWLAGQMAELETLQGLTVTAWSGIELALAERPSGAHLWGDPAAPLLQLSFLTATTTTGELALATAQDEETWGLYLLDEGESDDETFAAESTSRRRSLPELPTGLVSDLQVVTEADNIASISLTLGGARLIRRAGLVVEADDGTFEIREMDECILVQVDGARPGG